MGNLREFITSTGKLVLVGKDAETNEKLIRQARDNEIVLHTRARGSPFVNIKGKASKKDIKEAAIFCAAYSQAWKKAKVKKNILVHYFLGKDIFKDKNMALGTFGVKKFKEILVNREEIEKLENVNI